MARVFLDANVFLYAIGGEGPHRESCRAVLTAVGEGTLDGVTSSEVLQEILHVRARRMGIRDATVAVRAASEVAAEVLPVTQDDVLAACRVLEGHPKLAARDAIHVAVMQRAGIRLLVSVDRDFDALSEVERVHPRAALGNGR